MPRNRRERREAERRARKAKRHGQSNGRPRPVEEVADDLDLTPDDVRQLLAELLGSDEPTEVMPGIWVSGERASEASQRLTATPARERFVCGDGTELVVFRTPLDAQVLAMRSEESSGEFFASCMLAVKRLLRSEVAELTGPYALTPSLMAVTGDEQVTWKLAPEHGHPTAWFYDAALHEAVTALRPELVISVAHIWRHERTGEVSSLNPAWVDQSSDGWTEWLVLCARDAGGREQCLGAAVVRDGRVWLDEWVSVGMAPRQRAWLQSLVPLAPLRDASSPERLTEALSRPRAGEPR